MGSIHAWPRNCAEISFPNRGRVICPNGQPYEDTALRVLEPVKLWERGFHKSRSGFPKWKHTGERWPTGKRNTTVHLHWDPKHTRTQENAKLWVFCVALSEPIISAYFNKYMVVSFRDPRTSLFSSSDTASLAVSFPGPFWKPLVWLECNQLSLHCIPGLYNGQFKPSY